jgi:hypothetical protein
MKSSVAPREAEMVQRARRRLWVFPGSGRTSGPSVEGRLFWMRYLMLASRRSMEAKRRT